jgi:uncharacterized protein
MDTVEEQTLHIEKRQSQQFNVHEVLHELKHYLPAQAPLKDFIHHNTLHSFQTMKFHQALRSASEILGYRVTISIDEYRELYKSKKIREDILEKIIIDRKGIDSVRDWKEKVLHHNFEVAPPPRIGTLRANWKRHFQIDLDSLVQPLLFRTICGYLDQGIAMWNFPEVEKGFLGAIREMERNSFTSFFRTQRARHLLKDPAEIPQLLEILVGDVTLFKHYLFDQQFAHQGWSGIVSVIEDFPQSLLDQRKISIQDLVTLELIMEIDALESHFGRGWQPLSKRLTNRPLDLFAPIPVTELNEAISIWQEAFEWSYYDDVLEGLSLSMKREKKNPTKKSFQSMFCIDDREISIRRYLEEEDPNCETFGTPGFFTVEFFFQPEHGKFYTKQCPAPVTPKFLIKEVGSKSKLETDSNFSKKTHSLFQGWLISQTLGFWTAIELFINIFKPSMSPATAYSFRHMDKVSKLSIDNEGPQSRENDLQIGFAIEEMASRAEALLRSIGLVKDFAPIVYAVGHGSSSVNNPHYAAYDCGACSGRPGSVNSRVACYMLNHPEVRKILSSKGIAIPEQTQFVGGLHDTTRDEVIFFDEDKLNDENKIQHQKNEITFAKALDRNAKERSRRFESIDTRQSAAKIHEEVKIRSVSLFEPRPELNHATNALCIVGGRSMTRDLFLDRRAFLNSYDYSIDPEGQLLYGIMRPLGPVCGGINLEYFFSRVDNQKMGAGTKLPHNVMGLFGVANGIDGDLRPGLPSQMIEVHDPIRLMIIVEHFPDVVLKTIQKAADVYEWFINDWVWLVAVNPETKALSLFKDGAFYPYAPLRKSIETVSDMAPFIEKEVDNLPVYLLA